MKRRKTTRLYPDICFIGLSFLSLLAAPLKTGVAAIRPSLFTHAAEQNKVIKYQLNWNFGGKTQRGWALYSALICRTIFANGAHEDPDSEEFAAALAQWQSRVGLIANGVLDHGTWMKMVSIFQSNRRGIWDRSQSERYLELVPSSGFYDPQRPEELRKVDREALAAYQKMMAAAEADLSLAGKSSEKWLKIISAYRSPAYQAALRRRSPGAGRAGLAVNSPHFTGRALDLYVGGEPVSTKDQNRAIQVKTESYQWLVKNAARFGFKPYFYEPWHWEYNP